MEGLTVFYQRRDPKYGAEDLLSWGYQMEDSGGVFACIIGGLFVQYWVPKYSFLIYGFVTLLGGVFAMMMSSEAEVPKAKSRVQSKGQISLGDDKSSQSHVNISGMGFIERCKHDFIIIKECLKHKTVWRYYLFWLLAGICPTFTGYQYYYLKDVYQISQV
jgi:hypothetical protein